MADLIDRQAAFNRVLSLTIVDPAVAAYADGVCFALRDCPAVDAVEVVRCKDCKHGERYCDNDDKWVECKKHPGEFVVDRDFFCGYGDRREDGEQSRPTQVRHHREAEDRQAAIALFVRREEELCQAIEARTGRPVPIRPRFAEGIASALNKLHAVDAVEVVRCKSCRHIERGWCSLSDALVREDDFCNYGERRADNDD